MKRPTEEEWAIIGRARRAAIELEALATVAGGLDRFKGRTGVRIFAGALVAAIDKLAAEIDRKTRPGGGGR